MVLVISWYKVVYICLSEEERPEGCAVNNLRTKVLRGPKGEYFQEGKHMCWQVCKIESCPVKQNPEIYWDEIWQIVLSTQKVEAIRGVQGHV